MCFLEVPCLKQSRKLKMKQLNLLDMHFCVDGHPCVFLDFGLRFLFTYFILHTCIPPLSILPSFPPPFPLFIAPFSHVSIIFSVTLSLPVTLLPHCTPISNFIKH